jgi:transcriptional regulator GlxA family with amidase domain
MAKEPIHVSLVIFPESDPSILYGVFDTLWAAGQLWNALHGQPAGAPLFRPRLIGAQAGPVSLVTGVSIIPQDAIEDVQDTDIVFVPNVIVHSPAGLRGLDRRLLAWIRDRYEAGAHLCASCGGSLAIAEAGLLDGLEATTHWAYVDLFRNEFPQVRLSPKRVLVQTGPDQRIVCSGGASSWQDLVLFLVAKHGSPEEAMRLSKVFLYQWHREGQLPYACMMQNVTHDDRVIVDQQVWVAENYARPNLVAELVRRSNLPESTFSRRFKAATGYTPLAYIQTLRIEEAKQMLEATTMPVEQVAADVGYEDLAHFRRLFRRLTGMSPAGYRRKFRPPGYACIPVGDSRAPAAAARALAS